MPAFLRSLTGLLKSPPLVPEPIIIDVDGEQVTVTLRVNAQARRLILRLSKDGRGGVLTMPKRVSRQRAIAFLDHSSSWLATQLARERSKPDLRATGMLPLRGEPHRVIATGGRRGLVTVDAAARTLHVPGEPAHIERRLKDWLRAEARVELAAASRRYADVMQTTVLRITVRDQKSRWGSCAANGDLSYSWRLIMAPPFVLDYVAAHEVAHRFHMNHGPRFWRLVMKHNADVRAAKHWFKTHGADLHRHLP